MQARDDTGQRGYYPPKHVWVRVDELATPGILLDWRLVGDGPNWEAFVVWAAGGGDEPPAAHLEWVSQDRVRERVD